jgi:hypothetical protein
MDEETTPPHPCGNETVSEYSRYADMISNFYN